MATITNRIKEPMNLTARQARENVKDDLHRLEHSMDELAGHLVHTHDNVDRVKYKIKAPKRFVNRVVDEIRGAPFLYVGIASALGVLFYTTNRLTHHRART